MAGESFDLLVRQTNQTVTLRYNSVREMGIAKSHPRTMSPRPEEKTFQTIGVVIGMVLMLPARLLERSSFRSISIPNLDGILLTEHL